MPSNAPAPPCRRCALGTYGPLDRSCGARICGRCGDHQGLVRCFCGWAASGGDGYRELIEMGETIEEED